jgi:hypothetical protein
MAGHKGCCDVSVLDQTGRTWVGSINFYGPSHARRDYELVMGSRRRVIQPRSYDHDVRDDQTVPHLQTAIDQATTYRNRNVLLR